jgi:glycosyltransferase involved in cell wall biosynthesis
MGFIGVYLASKIRKFKTIFDAHAVHSIDVKNAGSPRMMVKLTQFLERFVIKRADFVVALSRNTFELYQRYNTAIDIIPVFFDTDLFVSKCSIRRCSSSSHKIVGLIGPFDVNIRNRYYLDFLYNNIDRFDKNISFSVIGQCERRIKNDRISYTGYLNSAMEYIDQLCRLNAVIVPEGISTTGPLNKILEPMACSIPVFTTPEGMIGLYWVEPGTDVLVFDVNGLVDKINELIFDDELMTEIGKNARKVVERYYSKQANEQRMLGILEKLVDRKQRNKR